MGSPGRTETEERDALPQLMGALVKGLRATQLYPANNPVYRQAMENVRSAFAPVWEATAELALDVSETELSHDGAVVLAQPHRPDSVAWTLFKDGVRRVVFTKGVEDDEIVRFLRLLQRARTLGPDAPDDVLTLLWEEDFQRIRYEAVELAAEGTALLQAPERPAPQRERVQQRIAAELAADSPQARGALDQLDPGAHFLGAEAVAHLEDEIAHERAHDLRADVLSILLDLLETQRDGALRGEVIAILEELLLERVSLGDWRAVLLLLRDVRGSVPRAVELSPEHRAALLEGLGARLSEPSALAPLLAVLDGAPTPTTAELEELLGELRPAALETALEWLPRLTGERLSASLEIAVARLAQAEPERLLGALRSANRSVVLGGIRLAAQLDLPAAVPALGELACTGETPIRRAAAEALAAAGTAEALRALAAALDDPDRGVRLTAVRAVARSGHRDALPKVAAAVSGKTLRSADLTEKTAFFEAFALLAGGDGVDLLRSLLEGRRWMRRKAESEIRACAAQALGKIGTAEARRVLEGAVGDRDRLVRTAVQAALRETE